MITATDLFIERLGAGKLGSSLREIRDINKERTPFLIFEEIHQTAFEIKDIFQELVNFAMDTDDISLMSSEEKEYWNEFVYYQSNDVPFSEDLNKIQALDEILMYMYNNTIEGEIVPEFIVLLREIRDTYDARLADLEARVTALEGA